MIDKDALNQQLREAGHCQIGGYPFPTVQDLNDIVHQLGIKPDYLGLHVDTDECISVVLVTQCRWFLRCENQATGLMAHPVLKNVPICDRCRDRVNAHDPYAGRSDAYWHGEGEGLWPRPSDYRRGSDEAR